MGRRDRSQDQPRSPGLPPDSDDLRRALGIHLPARTLWWLIAAGFAVRLILACTTWGTVDTISYIRFAFSIDKVGLLKSYAGDPLYNHPPVPALLSWVALRVAGRSGLGFAAAYRIPIVIADFGTAMLLWRILRGRGMSGHAALGVAAMYAWNPCALLISGYHFNTDPVVTMFSLLAVHLLQDRAKPLLAGLALGMAINIKLIPVLLIPPLFLTSRSWREMGMLFAGLALMSTPYIPPLLMEPLFRKHVLGYTSSPDPWGILLLLRLVFPGGISPEGEVVDPHHPAMFYNHWGSWLILGLSVAWGGVARHVRRFDRYRVVAVPYTLMLVLASGFGVQYLILVAPFFYITASARFANLYGVVAGVFLLSAYYTYWDGTWPVSSMFNRPFPTPLALMGLMPWGMLLWFLVGIAPRKGGGATASSGTMGRSRPAGAATTA